jgi:hypothetical protein
MVKRIVKHRFISGRETMEASLLEELCVILEIKTYQYASSMTSWVVTDTKPSSSNVLPGV